MFKKLRFQFWYNRGIKKWKEFLPYFTNCLSSFNIKTDEVYSADVLLGRGTFALWINNECRVFLLPMGTEFKNWERFARLSVDVLTEKNAKSRKEKVSSLAKTPLLTKKDKNE